MASGNNEQMYTNLPIQYPTLADVDEKVDNYPTVVSLVQTNYELLGFPPGVDILLEKPRYIQFARIRILDDDNKRSEGELCDVGSKNVRSRYTGQEFLIPEGYSGRFKVISKAGRYATLISVSQIIQDLPRYIAIEEETLYTPPGHSHATTCIAAGTRLEVKRVYIIEHCRYIECLSDSSDIYRFREDFPLNCTCVDDPDDHTFLEITGKSILLPKEVKFQNISANEVLKLDSDEAQILPLLLGGPVKILETCVRRKFFAAWMKLENSCAQTIGLIPSPIWNTLSIEIKTFGSDLKRRRYVQTNFGENIDSSFLDNGLYTMKPDSTGVVWTRTPSKYPGDSDTGTYVELWSGAPALPPRMGSLKKPPAPNASIPSAIPREAERQNNLTVKGREPHRRPSAKAPQNENNSIKEKTKTGFDKVDSYYINDDKAWHSLKETNKRNGAEPDPKIDRKVATLPDLKKLSKPNQTEEDFYSYSVEELVECFRFCGLETFAEGCSANKLDGDFFRNFEIDDLKTEPFCLKKFDVSKVKMIIHKGWRPRSDTK